MSNLARLEKAERALWSRLWGPNVRNRGQPMWMHNLKEHTALVTNKIPAAKRRAAAKKHWAAVRKHVTARGITSFLYSRSMRPMSPGGKGFQRLMRQTGVGKPNTKNAATSPRRSPNSPQRRTPSRRRTPPSPSPRRRRARSI